MPPNRLPRQMMCAWMDGARPKGRPNDTFGRRLSKTLRLKLAAFPGRAAEGPPQHESPSGTLQHKTKVHRAPCMGRNDRAVPRDPSHTCRGSGLHTLSCHITRAPQGLRWTPGWTGPAQRDPASPLPQPRQLCNHGRRGQSPTQVDAESGRRPTPSTAA